MYSYSTVHICINLYERVQVQYNIRVNQQLQNLQGTVQVHVHCCTCILNLNCRLIVWTIIANFPEIGLSLHKMGYLKRFPNTPGISKIIQGSFLENVHLYDTFGKSLLLFLYVLKTLLKTF